MALTRELALLKLDVDRRRKPSRRTISFRLRRAGYELRFMMLRRSPGGNGWHVWLEVSPRPTSPLEVVALQAILGSDPLREAVTLYRAKQWRHTPTFAKSWFNVLYGPSRARSRRVAVRRVFPSTRKKG